MQGGVTAEERKATFTSPWLKVSEARWQTRIAGREGHQKEKQTQVQGPPLFAVFFIPTVCQEVQHWIASHTPLHAREVQNQPNLVIFSPLSPEMTLLTGSGEMFQVWRKNCACTSCFKADQSVKKDTDSSQGADTSRRSPPSPLSRPRSPSHAHSPPSSSDC